MAIEEGNKMTQWKDRVAYAYWRGNPNVAPTRRDLLRCNVSAQEDWNTRLYIQVRISQNMYNFYILQFLNNLNDQKCLLL